MEDFRSGYKAMWVFVMFDLPVGTKLQRKRASGFRKELVRDGFQMMQFSIYFRASPSDENAAVHVRRVRRALPAEGKVRILRVTDKQFGRMFSFFGRKAVQLEEMPRQLALF